MKAELNIQIDAQPGIAELETLIATLEEVLADAPSLRLQVLDHLFALPDGGFKPGLVELVAVPTSGADGHAVIQLQVADRLRKFVSALAAGDFEILSIDQ